MTAVEDLYPSRRQARPAVLPRVDPVMHKGWALGAPIAKHLCGQFDALGYLILPGFFDAATTESLRAEARRLQSRPPGLRRETVVTESGSEEVRSVFEVHRQSEVMDRLTRDPRLLDIAEFLLGDRVYIHQSRLNYKPGFYGRDFFWHSDFETWHVEDGMPRMRALSVSILLEPNTEFNGPLLLMPGSHRRYLACVGVTPEDNYLTSLKNQEYGVPDATSLIDLARTCGMVAAKGAPGTAIVFDCNVMHGSNGNITPTPRSNAFIVYNAAGNRLVAPFGGTKPRPEFIAARKVTPLEHLSAR
ncbi:MAG: phytanoyl-CoA dioxygenase family protein [Caulobacteraceae bacterium]